MASADQENMALLGALNAAKSASAHRYLLGPHTDTKPLFGQFTTREFNSPTDFYIFSAGAKRVPEVKIVL